MSGLTFPATLFFVKPSGTSVRPMLFQTSSEAKTAHYLTVVTFKLRCSVEQVCFSSKEQLDRFVTKNRATLKLTKESERTPHLDLDSMSMDRLFEVVDGVEANLSGHMLEESLAGAAMAVAGFLDRVAFFDANRQEDSRERDKMAEAFVAFFHEQRKRLAGD